MTKENRIEELESPRKEIVNFLEENGWNIVVAGSYGVRGFGKGKVGNYTFEFQFMGKKGDDVNG